MNVSLDIQPCPSSVVLEAYVKRDFSPQALGCIEGHINACVACTAQTIALTKVLAPKPLRFGHSLRERRWLAVYAAALVAVVVVWAPRIGSVVKTIASPPQAVVRPQPPASMPRVHRVTLQQGNSY